MWPPPVAASVEQPNFLIAARDFILFTTAIFFAIFIPQTHEFSLSLNFPIFILFFSSRVPLGKLTRNPFTTKIAGSSFCSCLEYYFCYERGKISRNLFLSSRDEPACFTKLNSRFFWLERKNIKIFGPHRIASCCIIVLLVWLDDSFFSALCVRRVYLIVVRHLTEKKSIRLQTFFRLLGKGDKKKIRERKCKKSWIFRVC